jgi:hypothetical protein
MAPRKRLRAEDGRGRLVLCIGLDIEREREKYGERTRIARPAWLERERYRLEMIRLRAFILMES